MGSRFLANSICDSLRVRRVGAGITMRPKERRETGKQDLFRSRLDQIIDLNHALARLARAISPRAVVPPMHLSTRHGWPDVHVVAVSCVTVSQSGDPKSEPPDVSRCYGASVAPVAPV